MTAAAIALGVLVVAGLVVWLYEIRFQREYRERMDYLRYRAERRGVLL